VREFLQCYVRARELQADFFVDEIVEIADDKSEDPKSRQVRVAARTWVAAVRRPKVYGKTPGVSVNVAAGVVLSEEKQREFHRELVRPKEAERYWNINSMTVPTLATRSCRLMNLRR